MLIRHETGFTLVELMISIAIMSLLTLGFFIFGHNLENVSYSGTARTQLQQEASLILEDIVKDIREADTITINNVEGGANNSLTIDSPTIATVIYWSVENAPFAGHEESELYKNEGTGDELLLGDYNENSITINVADLTFSDDMGANLVTVDLDLQLIKTYPDLTTTTLEVVTFTASAEPRNR